MGGYSVKARKVAELVREGETIELRELRKLAESIGVSMPTSWFKNNLKHKYFEVVQGPRKSMYYHSPILRRI